jgi:dihydrofolate synthase/folylpolyglutamate synthase
MPKSKANASPRHTGTDQGVASQIELKPASMTTAAAATSPATFDQALSLLLARADLEKARVDEKLKHEYKLDRMRALLAAMGNPQESIRCVHIAGTKGKGSTCEMVATCLEACGYTVGLYTSPHLVSIRERLRLNGRPISEADFVSITASVISAAQDVERAHGPCTFFELTTAMGFQFFAEQAVDCAVIEVGLGGLLDCTNVITPEVAAISTIGFDHMQILGDTLELIAEQKAGIFKPGVPALVIDQTPSVVQVFRDVAQRVGAPLTVVGQDIEFAHRMEFPAGQTPILRLNLTTPRHEYEHVAVPLAGEHQALNCALALAIIDKLCERGFHCPVENVLAGLARVKLPGRFEIINSSPRVLLDGAHNPESMRALMKTIGTYLQYDALLVIFGCAADKDVKPMLQALSMAADKVIFTAAEGNARAARPQDLAKMYYEVSDGKAAQVSKNLTDALNIARPSVNRSDLVCITGSFYLVGEAKKLMAAKAQASGKR